MRRHMAQLITIITTVTVWYTICSDHLIDYHQLIDIKFSHRKDHIIRVTGKEPLILQFQPEYSFDQEQHL